MTPAPASPQLELRPEPQPVRFNGADYQPDRDNPRLIPQLERVKSALANGAWWTLEGLAARCRAPEASVSAQLRHLRKPRFGSHTVERRHVAGGLYEYRLVPR